MRPQATLALLAFAMLTTSLDQYIVVVALPSIERDVGFSAQTLQWVISANAVTSAGFLLLGGRAADLLGRRRIFVTGLALYAGASLAGGLAAGRRCSSSTYRWRVRRPCWRSRLSPPTREPWRGRSLTGPVALTTPLGSHRVRSLRGR